MKICEKCIIPETFPGADFQDGVCSFCRAQAGQPLINDKVLGEDKLKEKLDGFKGQGKYDCSVPISGGKDSSYVLYYLVKRLKLKPLALYFDNGFIAKAAKENVKKICDQLGVNLVIGQATKYRRRQAEEALQMARYLGRLVKVCGNCENNLRSFVINESVKRGIPAMVWGSTRFEDKAENFFKPENEGLSKSYGSLGSVLSKIKAAFNLLGKGKIINKPKVLRHGVKFMYYLVRDNIASKTPVGLKKFNPFLEVSFTNKGAEAVAFFDYIKYEPYEHIATLEREIGWQAPTGKEARMDCKLHALVNEQHLKDTGITGDGFTLSVLVRNGLISREEALVKEEAVRKDLEAECEEVKKELGS